MPADPDDNASMTFLLGWGRLKGGTTWLHDYLAPSPRCATGYRKEYHVFNTPDLKPGPFVVDRTLSRAERSLTRVWSRMRVVAQHRRSTYEFVAERCQSLDLQTSWPSARFEL